MLNRFSDRSSLTILLPLAFSWFVVSTELAHAETLSLIPQPAELTVEERRAQAAEFRRIARSETIAGAILYPLGSALLASGFAIIILGDSGSSFTAGVTASALGCGGILSGVPLLITGAVDKHRAIELNPRVSVTPTRDPLGNLGASANLNFAF
jgi:hypothetical protein